MKLFSLLFALALVICLAGCISVDSLNPLYTDKDVVFDPALLGQWGPPSDGLNFAKVGDNAYRIVMSSKDDETGQIVSLTFDAHLVQLQGHRFLDVLWKNSPSSDDTQTMPEVRLVRTNDAVQAVPRFVPAGMGSYLELLPGKSGGNEQHFSIRRRQTHQFFKVVIEDEGRTLKLVGLDDDWTAKQIGSGKLVIDHENTEGSSVVLTGRTPQIQQLVLEHVDDKEAFQDEIVVHRLAATQPR
jgi:hypothetical protein